MVRKMDNSYKKVKVSIGIPVFNGEPFIKQKIENILSQTFQDFELIISDNSSIDMTSTICKNFSEKDNRIKYFRQKENIGAVANFNFILDKAIGNYFLWSAVDDLLSPTFIEKNIRILEKNSNVVCSVSKMNLYGEKSKSLEIENNDSILKRKKKKLLKDFGYLNTFPASGSYENRIKEYMKNLRHNQIIYGIFRTNQIKKSLVRDSFLWVEGCTILNILKFGELFVVDEVLMEIYDGGVSRGGMIGVTKHMHENIIGKIFPNYHFTSWCFKNLSKQIFFKNLGFFIKVNCIGLFSLGIDLIRKITKVS